MAPDDPALLMLLIRTVRATFSPGMWRLHTISADVQNLMIVDLHMTKHKKNA